VIFRPGETLELNLQLDDGAETLYPRALLYRGATQEAAVSLAHVAQGRYRGLWTPATDEDYVAIFIVYTDAGRTIISEDYTREAQQWRPISAVSPRLADDVWDEDLSGHTSAGSAGEALARTELIEKILRNRLELAEGSTNNWILYDDDNATPLLRWSVTDKDGDGILMEKHIPARRTRGI
jgi:hypothetical protein